MASGEQEEHVERCENCRFWLKSDNERNQMGECRRGPAEIDKGLWQWCGEFQPHPKSEDEQDAKTAEALQKWKLEMRRI